MNLQYLKNKYLLLDTNVLINSSKYSEKFSGFYEFIREELEMSPVLDSSIKFEFLRGARTREDKEILLHFLFSLFGKDYMELPVNKEIFEIATGLANVYSRKNPSLNKQISFVDCFISAQMFNYNKHKTQLFLATSDNNDFPLFIFDRIHIHTIDLGKDIINIGIYRFNTAEYKKLMADFNKN